MRRSKRGCADTSGVIEWHTVQLPASWQHSYGQACLLDQLHALAVHLLNAAVDCWLHPHSPRISGYIQSSQQMQNAAAPAVAGLLQQLRTAGASGSSIELEQHIASPQRHASVSWGACKQGRPGHQHMECTRSAGPSGRSLRTSRMRCGGCPDTAPEWPRMSAPCAQLALTSCADCLDLHSGCMHQPLSERCILGGQSAFWLLICTGAQPQEGRPGHWRAAVVVSWVAGVGRNSTVCRSRRIACWPCIGLHCRCKPPCNCAVLRETGASDLHVKCQRSDHDGYKSDIPAPACHPPSAPVWSCVAHEH